ncbi:MAG: hypothetical protein WKF94_09540 [Solirubrobacteraceae bacterium]
MPDYAHLPGGDLIEAGLADLARGVRDSPEALLVAAAGSRLRAAGVPVPEGVDDAGAPLALYHALQPEHGNDAHGRYNALLGQLDSFACAAEHEARR